jgi:L-malate glycosyltransferase
MVVLHVLAPAPVGGLERVVQALALGLQRQDVEVHVAPVFSEALPRGGHPFLEPMLDSAVHVHPIQVPARGYLRERAEIAMLCRRIQPDVVHTHGYRSDLVAASAARAHGAAVVSTVHGFTGGGFRNRLYETLQRRAYRRFDAVIAVSRALSTLLAAQGVPASRLRLIQNAWAGDVKLLSKAQAQTQLGLDAGRFQIGWVGRLSHEKGADQMVDAFARLDPTKFGLTFIGDGPEKPRLQALAHRAGVAGSIRWAGSVSDAATLFRAFDAFVLSSRTEGTPMVLFEAMAAGTPIVAMKVGGVPDVVDPSCALMVEPGNTVQLANAIAGLSRDPHARNRAQSAQDKVKSHFSAEQWIERHIALYREFQRLPEDACLTQSR